jgi:predicted amidohydrolase
LLVLFFHYVFIYLCIKPSNKAKRLITKATNQGSQLVVFLDIFVGGYPKGNALGNKLAMGHENY